MTCNTAVFYDIENLTIPYKYTVNKTLKLDEVYRRIFELEEIKSVSIQRAYADWAMQANRNLRSYILQIGIEPVQIFNTNQNDKVKNAADVSLIIDAVELISKRPEIENYVIVSGDGIFAFLAKKLHEYGKKVIGCGYGRNSNIIFRNACDIFLSMEKDDQSLVSVIRNLNKGTVLTMEEHEEYKIEKLEKLKEFDKAAHIDTENKTVATSSTSSTGAISVISVVATDETLQNKLPKNDFTKALAKAQLPVLKNTKDNAEALHAIKLLTNTLLNLTHITADIEISMFKTYVDYYLPNFKTKAVGFSKFGEFMRFLLTASPYCLVVTDGTIVRISRRELPLRENDKILDDMAGLSFILEDGSRADSLFEIDDKIAFTFNFSKTNIVAKVEDEEPIAPTEPEEEIEEPQELEKIPEVQVYPPYEDEEPKENVRKWIKNSFKRLSSENRLTNKELKQLLDLTYVRQVFGIRSPVCKELVLSMDIQEQRIVNGRVKYWKDIFAFNGKNYLIYKEWSDIPHRSRFETWIKEKGI